MIRNENQVIWLEGPVTLATVKGDIAPGHAAIEAGAATVDCSGLTEADSAALALLLDWQRHARAAGKPLAVRALPSGLASLAGVYGVDAVLPLGA